MVVVRPVVPRSSLGKPDMIVDVRMSGSLLALRCDGLSLRAALLSALQRVQAHSTLVWTGAPRLTGRAPDGQRRGCLSTLKDDSRQRHLSKHVCAPCVLTGELWHHCVILLWMKTLFRQEAVVVSC